MLYKYYIFVLGIFILGTTCVALAQTDVLVFTGQPSSTTAGDTISPPVVVQIQDESGNDLPQQGVEITLSVVDHPEILSGTLTQTTNSSGEATFDDLSISEPDTGYTLEATSPQLSSAISDVFEITAFESDVITVNLRVFLQGPFDTSELEMINSLNANGHLPASHPYNASPWNYTGPEAVTDAFFAENPDIIDWVLLEIRTDTGTDSIVGQRAALITREGFVVDVDGTGPVEFTELTEGEYFIVFRHRNHVDIMSTVPVSLNQESELYDFTTGPGQAFGNGALTVLSEGVYGAFAGDGNADGQITAGDFNDFNPALRLDTPGYQQADFTMTGIVSLDDYEIFVINNRRAIHAGFPD